MGGVFGGREGPRLLGEQNEIEEYLRRHMSDKEVERALPSGLCGRRDVYAFAPVPPYAARVECQVKGVQQGAFKLGREILGCVGWKPGESLPHEQSRLGGKVSRAEHQEREKPLTRSRKNHVRAMVSLNKEIDVRKRSCCTSCIRARPIRRNCISWKLSMPACPLRVTRPDVEHAYSEAAQEQRGRRRDRAPGQTP